MRLAFAALLLLILAACGPSKTDLAKCEMDAEKQYPKSPDVILGDDPKDIIRTNYVGTCMQAKGFFIPEKNSCKEAEGLGWKEHRTECYRSSTLSSLYPGS